MKHWVKRTHKELDQIISTALDRNVSYSKNVCLGVPASVLDQHVFYEHAAFLKDAPLLRAYVQNPNHIGCHTFGDSEPFFEGTHELEKEVIELLCVDIFKAQDHSCDGYVASGGTEANIQAAWIYRNYFISRHGAKQSDIALLSSSDTHYSVAKAANLLGIDMYSVPVNDNDRVMDEVQLDAVVKRSIENGIRFFIVFCNMGTTMFGSVDDPDVYKRVLDANKIQFKLHVDGAFGGFVYPVSDPVSHLNFANPIVDSITLDAHKMLQAPYGTGIFLARKGLMQHAYTKQASYVSGMDMTLNGSRGGVNAIAIWMILFTYGPFGWLEKINKLLYRTQWICDQLNKMGVVYYRHPKMNIVTIRSRYIIRALADKYKLVPDSHNDDPAWYKIVVMDHVSIDQLQAFIHDLKSGI